ncbi:MAG: TadE/TadG family type IV pilus assembly protein [Deltaproteobacteria bacterium]|nr:TadE/TadG family type IV pilus assembly protein [Deltaproteobacteria bacterium]
MDERAQAAVETALVLPLMLFLFFGLLQLIMVQHARLMTGYAAFNAARAGVVWNGDPCMMRRAAVVSLLPTLGATDTISGTSEPFDRPRPGLMKTWTRAQALVSTTGAVAGLLAELGIQNPGIELVDVEVLNPTEAMLGHFHNGELPFDAVAGDPAGRDFQSRPQMREATRLTIRVKYLYPMRIPFANWLVFSSYLAAHAGMSQTGAIINAENSRGVGGAKNLTQTGAGAQVEGAKAIAAGGAEVDAEGREIFSRGNLALLWQLGLSSGTWLFPLSASHTMRMQSNFYQRSFNKAGFCPPWS